MAHMVCRAFYSHTQGEFHLIKFYHFFEHLDLIVLPFLNRRVLINLKNICPAAMK